MADQANSDSPAIQGVDIDKVSAWLNTNIDGAQAPFD